MPAKLLNVALDCQFALSFEYSYGAPLPPLALNVNDALLLFQQVCNVVELTETESAGNVGVGVGVDVAADVGAGVDVGADVGVEVGSDVGAGVDVGAVVGVGVGVDVAADV